MKNISRGELAKLVGLTKEAFDTLIHVTSPDDATASVVITSDGKRHLVASQGFEFFELFLRLSPEQQADFVKGAAEWVPNPGDVVRVLDAEGERANGPLLVRTHSPDYDVGLLFISQ